MVVIASGAISYVVLNFLFRISMILVYTANLRINFQITMDYAQELAMLYGTKLSSATAK